MTEASYICNFIKDHPDNWRELLEAKQIKIKDEGSLSIFNYDIYADFSDPIVQEARGIIIDTDACEVKAWPFRKFFNSHESSADDIDWKHAKVTEKIDGSIIKLWNSEDGWVVSSNSCIYATEAVLPCKKSIMDLFLSAVNYDALQTAMDNRVLDENRTYIFELVSPFNQIVVKYPETKLYLIGIRDNRLGREVPIFENDGKYYGDGITPVLKGIDMPKTYPVHTLEECIKASAELNKNRDYPDQEGFVVVDNKFHRVKVKAPEYLIYHHMINNGYISKERAFNLFYADDFDPANFDKIVAELPESVKDALTYYRDTFRETEDAAVIFINKVRQMAKEGASRKEIAMQIKDTPYAGFAFKGLDYCDASAEAIVKENRRNLLKVVIDYEPNIEKEEEKDF